MQASSSAGAELRRRAGSPLRRFDRISGYGAGSPGAGGGSPLEAARHYLIFYTPGAEVVRIERILHGARDVEEEFRPSE
jgi:plasmid stabilization system protein ParE